MAKRKIELFAVLLMAGVICASSTLVTHADNIRIEKGDATVIVPEDMLVTDVTSFLNVRLEPNSSSQVITKLVVGQSVQVVEFLDKWVKVNVDGQEGYVFTDYTLTGEDMGKYIENNLDLFKKTARQTKTAYQGVYKTKEAAKEDAVTYKISCTVNNDAMVYKTKSTDKVIEDQLVEVKKCVVSKGVYGLRLRTEPSKKDGKIIKVLSEGQSFDFIKEEGEDWVKVKVGNGTGYIAKEFVDIKTVEEPESNILGKVKKEDKLKVIDVKKTWVEVEYQDGTTGFMKRKYVDLSVKEKDASEDFIGFIENNVSYEVASLGTKYAKLILPDGQEGYTKAESLLIEILIDPPEVDYSVIPSEADDFNFKDIKIKNIKVGEARKEIVQFALQFLGRPYVWGGTDLKKGVDCSGFTQQIMKHAGISIDRCSYEQAENGKEVAFEDLRAGDLIFYWNNEAGRIGHVALYIGDGKVVHASSRKTGIKISQWNYRKPYKAVDVIGD